MFPEAMQHFERALDILKEMPADRNRNLRELKLQTVLGHTAFVYQGEGSADAGKALARAVELAAACEDIRRKAYALTLLCYNHVERAELQRASHISRALYETFQATRNSEIEFWANHLMGFVALCMGDFRKAEQFLGAAEGSQPWIPGEPQP